MQRKKYGKSNYIHVVDKDIQLSASDVLSSWTNNTFSFPEEEHHQGKGFRKPQRGALYAIKAHWTVSKDVATIVMPTGTGKTEVMIATVVSERIKKVCIIVPSKMLQKQTIKRFSTLGKLFDIGAIDNSFKEPIIGCLNASPDNLSDLTALINDSNIIVTTAALLNSKKFQAPFLELLARECDTLIIDEAHHLPAKSWQRIKKQFEATRCLQFTATPFRNDGKKIDGDIIYNFPLALAQKQGYFKPINFRPIYEFDDSQKDLSIAKAAVKLLKTDIKKGYPHVLLVRTDKQKRAQYLFEKIYLKHFKKYEPVLIISNNTAADNKKALDSVRAGKSKIIVCVDMFSEGIDIPQLKICAIHDKYKSLPITIQFIGRFARTHSSLGEASIVANIVDDDIKEALEELYAQDADWNQLLKNASDEKTEEEMRLQKLARGFIGTDMIPIKQITPKISMFMYRVKESTWDWKNWHSAFKKDTAYHMVNEQENILVIVERRSVQVDWTDYKDINGDDWNLYILYWDEKNQVFFIHATDKGVADRLAKSVFENPIRVIGEEVFRCLHGINRLMLSSVGLKTTISHRHIRYRMFAGADVAEGISRAVKGSSIKSNLFGTGYRNGDKISIGVSYKGTIWARWIESIDFWKNWCDTQAQKILDSSIDTKTILEGALVPEAIDALPEIAAYRIDFPSELEQDLEGTVCMGTDLRKSHLISISIHLIESNSLKEILFSVTSDIFNEIFSLSLSENNYSITHKEGDQLTLYRSRGREVSLVEFFNDNPPMIYFVDGSSLEGNLLVKLQDRPTLNFQNANITVWDWIGINIKKESQGRDKDPESIQHRVIATLKASAKYCLVFDDDGSGEIADVIAIQEDKTGKRLIFELYHCKYSTESTPGARVKDLYEVCGQAEKSIKWVKNSHALLTHLRKRNSIRIQKNMSSRYEQGDNKLTYTLKNKLKIYSSEYHIYIVQPGVSQNNITSEMHQVLCSAETYLKETYDIPLQLICSQ
ncbi:DEAD/DEAH box helicase [Selenomonas noxia]